MKKLILTSILAIAATQASAAEPSYTFVEGGYSFLNGHTGYLDADQAYIKGSYQFKDSNLYMLSGISHSNVRDFSISANSALIGVGYKADLTQNVDMVTDISYEMNRVNGDNIDAALISHGYRFAKSEKFDMAAKLNLYFAMDDFVDDEVGLSFEATHALGEKWRAAGKVELTDSNQHYSLGLQRTF